MVYMSNSSNILSDYNVYSKFTIQKFNDNYQTIAFCHVHLFVRELNSYKYFVLLSVFLLKKKDKSRTCSISVENTYFSILFVGGSVSEVSSNPTLHQNCCLGNKSAHDAELNIKNASFGDIACCFCFNGKLNTFIKTL